MIEKVFNLVTYAGRKRIRDRHIQWKETYREKSMPLKKRYTKQIGEGSYRRWEGHDYTTNGDYFVVVGPALTKEGRKSYFSGIKKYPPSWSRKKVYAPYGEYFANIAAALSHANEMWGVPYPRNQHNYTVSNLQGIEIARHVKG